MDIREVDGYISGELSQVYSMVGELTDLSSHTIDGSVEIGPSDFTTKAYDGPYTAQPTFDEQILATKQKYMIENVTVNPVSYSLASSSDINNLF